MKNERIILRAAIPADVVFADQIIREMESSAIARGSRIAKRSAAAVIEKIDAGKAILAITENGKWVGFSYLETWDDEKFISNSGLIVSPPYRNQGVASQIKKQIFRLSRSRYPQAKINTTPCTFRFYAGFSTIRNPLYRRFAGSFLSR